MAAMVAMVAMKWSRSPRQQLDLTDHERVLGLVGEVQPSVIVNCAGYNDVDGAEEAAVDALTVNALAVRSLARAAAAAGATLVHYTTDFVFDGTATTPYVEEQRPNPQSIYAMSKLMGEWFATDAPRHYVLRVESLFGGSSDRSSSVRATGLTGTFYTSGNEREPLERKESDMTKKRHTPEQIVTLLRQVEVAVANGKGTPQACKEAAITEQTYYRWRKEYGGLKLAQAKRLKELEKENSRLKHVVAELSLEKQILREVAQGNS